MTFDKTCLADYAHRELQKVNLPTLCTKRQAIKIIREILEEFFFIQNLSIEDPKKEKMGIEFRSIVFKSRTAIVEFIFCKACRGKLTEVRLDLPDHWDAMEQLITEKEEYKEFEKIQELVALNIYRVLEEASRNGNPLTREEINQEIYQQIQGAVSVVLGEDWTFKGKIGAQAQHLIECKDDQGGYRSYSMNYCDLSRWFPQNLEQEIIRSENISGKDAWKRWSLPEVMENLSSINMFYLGLLRRSLEKWSRGSVLSEMNLVELFEIQGQKLTLGKNQVPLLLSALEALERGLYDSKALRKIKDELSQIGDFGPFIVERIFIYD